MLGGAQQIVADLAACLPALGVGVRVVLLQSGPFAERLRVAGVEVDVLGAGRLRDPWRYAATVRRLHRHIRSHQPTAVVATEAKGHVYLAPAARGAIPVFWIQAGMPDPPSRIDRLASRLPATGVIALSTDAAEAQRRIVRRAPVHVMHPGIDTERFASASGRAIRSQHGLGADRVLVALVGRLQPWKGQEQFLRAAALLASDRRTTFAVVGGAILGWEGDYEERLHRLAGDLRIRDRVIFTGHTDEVPQWMAASDIVVNASNPEPFGLVVIEAMAAGCAVVAVSAGGPRDVIEHARNGMLCADASPAQLAGAIGELIAQPATRQRIGELARERVAASFTRERTASRLLEILRMSAGGARSGSEV